MSSYRLAPKVPVDFESSSRMSHCRRYVPTKLPFLLAMIARSFLHTRPNMPKHTPRFPPPCSHWCICLPSLSEIEFHDTCLKRRIGPLRFFTRNCESHRQPGSKTLSPTEQLNVITYFCTCTPSLAPGWFCRTRTYGPNDKWTVNVRGWLEKIWRKLPLQPGAECPWGGGKVDA